MRPQCCARTAATCCRGFLRRAAARAARCRCRTCGAARAPRATRAFDAAWSAVAYAGVAREVLHALKFAAARPLAAVMAEQITRGPAGEPAGGARPPRTRGRVVRAVIVAVPPHPVRRRIRGFDPARPLTRALARTTGPADGSARCAAAARASRQLGAIAREASRGRPARLSGARNGTAPGASRRRRSHDGCDAPRLRASAARRGRGARRGGHLGAHVRRRNVC